MSCPMPKKGEGDISSGSKRCDKQLHFPQLFLYKPTETNEYPKHEKIGQQLHNSHESLETRISLPPRTMLS